MPISKGNLDVDIVNYKINYIVYPKLFITTISPM